MSYKITDKIYNSGGDFSAGTWCNRCKSKFFDILEVEYVPLNRKEFMCVDCYYKLTHEYVEITEFGD